MRDTTPSVDDLRGRPLRNMTCPYCGIPIASTVRTKEHVIGRKFVPVGTLHNQWNLILWACQTCNRRKSSLEDDIAAITMHLHTTGLSNMNDSRAQVESLRRSHKSGHRGTGKSVSRSSVKVKIKAAIGLNGILEGHFTAPPQIDAARAAELARFQMMAFFYFLTFDRAKGVGYYWPGEFCCIDGYLRSDWGNPVQIFFMKQIVDWDYRLILNTATGYFRALIRRFPHADCWAWSLEWNAAYRMIGYFGDSSSINNFVNELPLLQARAIVGGLDGNIILVRTEQSLSEEDDTLFDPGKDMA